MSECCGPSQPCCGGAAPPPYEYGPQPYVTGEVDTFAGKVPRITTDLSPADSSGTMRVRLGIRRSDYRVRPGLYAIGEPDDTAPVLVTGNYKLSVDAVRSELGRRDVWLLVIDSRGVNVWCAAGKGVFSTAEVVRSVRDAKLEQIVSHTRLVLPQLGATGVAGHEVRAQTGFRVTWGPVRAADLPAFLDAGMKATPEMRRVRFELRDRAKLVGVELSLLWRWKTLAGAAAFVAAALLLARFAPTVLGPALLALLVAVLAVIAGAALVPLMLPMLPGRSFSAKGAIVGALVIAATLTVAVPQRPLPMFGWGLLAAGIAVASYLGMNFTGSSTYTSPSGVEWEMRRAIPLQLIGVIGGVALFAVGLVMG